MGLLKISEVAKKGMIPSEYLIPYGFYKAKIDLKIRESLRDKEDGKLILVSAITPTKAGEGKTTTAIALEDGLSAIGEKAMLCLREPSLGPVFGLKGGATGAGKARIEPSEDINLHFNGDMHAITSAINLIAAVLDNSIYQGNPLNIDPTKVVWKRAIDMNDRTLRNIIIGIGDKNGIQRNDGFIITVASELMAIFCLAKDEEDFLERLERIIVAYTYDEAPITVKDLKVTHAVMRLLKEAFNPNLVQTLEGNPVLVHGGPFANIAHGCNSLIATKLALKLSDITITEAGFAADLGAEKFLDIVCQEGNLTPNLVILVATIKALKLHGGKDENSLNEKDLNALEKGFSNLKRHAENIKKYGLGVLVAINHFDTDEEDEISALSDFCKKEGLEYSLVDSYSEGSLGSKDLAYKALKLLNANSSKYHPLYNRNAKIKEKIETIAKEIYRADNVIYSAKANEDLAKIEKLGFENAYICMAKTPNSFSDDPNLLGAPEHFSLRIREVSLGAGSNFIIPLTGNILTLPGLPKIPAAIKMEDLPW